MNEPRIALIHATRLAIDPVAAAFARLWPAAACMNLLDDRLSQDRASAGRLDDAMGARLATLFEYASRWGADGVLFTCSAFGPAIEAIAARGTLPVLKPNEAMFGEALAACRRTGGRRVGLLTTFAPAAASLREEFLAEPGAGGIDLAVACADGAMDALARGDATAHDRLLVEAARGMRDRDVVMLGQFSMAAARPLVQDALPCPVLTSPDSAVTRLRDLLSPSGDRP